MRKLFLAAVSAIVFVSAGSAAAAQAGPVNNVMCPILAKTTVGNVSPNSPLGRTAVAKRLDGLGKTFLRIEDALYTASEKAKGAASDVLGAASTDAHLAATEAAFYAKSLRTRDGQEAINYKAFMHQANYITDMCE